MSEAHMNERRKYLGRANKEYHKSYTSKTVRIDKTDIQGYATRFVIHESVRPYMVGEKGAELCIGDDGYSELQYLPDDENWMLWAIYDDRDRIVEWYIDITRKNAIDENGEPYCDDLYLDLALMPDGRVLIFDEDELRDAYDRGGISAGDLELAYRVKDELMQLISVSYMEELCEKLKSFF